MPDMKGRVNSCVFAAMLFYFLLILASLFENMVGVWYAIFYATCFAIPVALVFFVKRLLGEKLNPLSLGIAKDNIGFALPLMLPTLGAIILISLITSRLMALGGFYSSLVIGEPLALALLTYAVIPAVGEELLFRYLPIRLLGDASPLTAVIVSSLLFSVSHASIFQIPYALFAGIIFALIDIKCGSVLPSAILHLMNNVIGVLAALYPSNIVFAVFLMLFGVLTLLSIIAVIIKRERYKGAFKPIISHGSVCITVPTVLYLAFLFLFSVISLLA